MLFLKKTALAVLLVGLALCGPSAWAFQAAGGGPGDAPYTSGGFGEDERAAMEQMAGQYNLRLEFAEKDGHYMGDVVVSLSGPATLDAVSTGPWFLAKLPPGVYKVRAEYQGVAKTTTVTVPAKGQAKAALFW